jgi:multicomponent Na+:H+ antiporter subunit E
LFFHAFFIFLGTLFYCALNENFSVGTILVGGVIAASGSLLFTRKPEAGLCRALVFRYVSHLLRLFLNIFRGSVTEILRLHRRRPVSIDSFDCAEEISTVALANAITLTPGTLTLEKEDDTLLVLSFEDRKRELHR